MAASESRFCLAAAERLRCVSASNIRSILVDRYLSGKYFQSQGPMAPLDVIQIAAIHAQSSLYC
jgi:hypothetical protein